MHDSEQAPKGPGKRTTQDLLECTQYGKLYRVIKVLKCGDAAICVRVRRKDGRLWMHKDDRLTAMRTPEWKARFSVGDYLFQETRFKSYAHWPIAENEGDTHETRAFGEGTDQCAEEEAGAVGGAPGAERPAEDAGDGDCKDCPQSIPTGCEHGPDVP